MENVPDSGVWPRIREEVQRDAAREPMLASFLNTVALSHPRLEELAEG